MLEAIIIGAGSLDLTATITLPGTGLFRPMETVLDHDGAGRIAGGVGGLLSDLSATETGNAHLGSGKCGGDIIEDTMNTTEVGTDCKKEILRKREGTKIRR